MPVLTADQRRSRQPAKAWLALLLIPLALLAFVVIPVAMPLRLPLPGGRVLSLITHRDASRILILVTGPRGLEGLAAPPQGFWSVTCGTGRVTTLRVGKWVYYVTLRPTNEAHHIFLNVEATDWPYVSRPFEWPGGH